ncbi:MAG TPA: DUF6431 domain-containing protein [Sedimentibacter sp.]|nr:DUF6431 domain-containing protein [Sedimentibacter sp.]
MVLVKNYLKHNPLENPNQVKHAIEKLNELPETHLFRSLLTVIEQFDKPFIQPLIERLQERLGQPVTVTVTGSITVTETEEEAENMHGAEAAPCQPTALPWYRLHRLKCPGCGKLHLELPDFMAPKKHYEARLIEDVMAGRSDSCPADDSTIRSLVYLSPGRSLLLLKSLRS